MCGIVGIWGEQDAKLQVFKALMTLQHRGQDAAGILGLNLKSKKFELKKILGQVSTGFEKIDLVSADTFSALGHCRYPTSGPSNNENIQPFVTSSPVGMAICHNGNLVNYLELKEELEGQGHYFFSDNDGEVLLKLLSKDLNFNKDDLYKTLEKNVLNILNKTKGGQSTIGILPNNTLFGFRDKHGIRPLLFAQKGKSFAFASESSSLKFLGYEEIEDVQPGVLILITPKGKVNRIKMTNGPSNHCHFEWIYFSNPDSVIENHSVYKIRLQLGKLLAEKIKKQLSSKALEIDSVVPVPDSGRIGAQSLSESLGIPLREALIKNRYVQRSFIMEGQKKRDEVLDFKLRPVQEEIKDKSILLVDDSIVRGSTSRKLVKLLKAMGAKKIYLASTCPPIKHECFYGIDFPDKEELIANSKNEYEIAKILGADSVIYPDLDDFLKLFSKIGICTGCLNGNYPYRHNKYKDFSFWRKKQGDLNENSGHLWQ